MILTVDQNIVDALNVWLEHGINPGSCTELLLAGKYDEALLHAHPLVKPHWRDHIRYVESLPLACRGENMETWKKNPKLVLEVFDATGLTGERLTEAVSAAEKIPINKRTKQL